MRPASQGRRSQRAAAIESCGSGSEQARGAPRHPRASAGNRLAQVPGLPGAPEGGWRKMRDLLAPLSSNTFSGEVSSCSWERMYKSESDAWRRSAAAVFPLRKCRRRRLSLGGDASRKPLSSCRLLLELGRHRLPGVSGSGGGVMDARRGGRAVWQPLPRPAPPRAPPRPPPLPARPVAGSARARPAGRPSPFPPRGGARSPRAPVRAPHVRAGSRATPPWA